MTTSKQTLSLSKALTAGLIGGLIAAIINVILYFLFQAINGGPLLVAIPGTTGPEPFPIFPVIMLSIIPGLVAGVLFWVLSRFTDNATRWFLIVAAIIFVAFFFGPIGAASGVVAILALELMHVGAAVPIIWSLLRRT